MRLHIERLVIDGFALTGAEAALVRAALEAELTDRLASEAPGSWGNISVPALAFGSIAVPPRAGPDRLGRAAAAALHRGLAG